MARLYCPKDCIQTRFIVINERKQIHHLYDVLRLKVHDDVTVFDGQGSEYSCQIQELSRKSARLIIRGKANVKLHKICNLTIACALPRQNNRFDDLVDKLSQLGVDKIIPMITERVVLQWGSNQRQQHLNRWCKIAQQSCRQSGRNILPIIEPVKEINQILTSRQSYDLRLIPTVVEKKQKLRDILSEASPKNVLILIGPEGDFTTKELIQAKDAGFIPVFLGDLVLRVETAAIAVAAFFRLNCL